MRRVLEEFLKINLHWLVPDELSDGGEAVKGS